MCNNAVVENDETLMYVPNCYKNKKMRNKVVDNYAHVLKLVPDCYKTQKMCNKAFDTSPSSIQYIRNSIQYFNTIY